MRWLAAYFVWWMERPALYAMTCCAPLLVLSIWGREWGLAVIAGVGVVVGAWLRWKGYP